MLENHHIPRNLWIKVLDDKIKNSPDIIKQKDDTIKDEDKKENK